MIKITTIKDVAKLAGVSSSTVSIVINGQAKERRIPQRTVNKVMEAINILNYQPNVTARKLRSSNKSDYVIGVYWASDFRSNYLARFINGLQNEILKSKHSLNVLIRPYKNNQLHLESGIKSLNTYNAAIIAATSAKDMEFLNNNKLLIPIVLMNRYSENYSSVNLNNIDAGKKAAEFLIDKGIKSIATITTDSDYLATIERVSSFKDTCSKNGIIIPKEFNIKSVNSIAGGAIAMEELLKLNNKPEAIFCDSDSIAKGVLHILYSKGIKVPDDIEVIAFGLDNPESNEYSNPSLTVIDIPLEKMAATSMKLITQILTNNIREVQHVKFDSELIIRDSCPQ